MIERTLRETAILILVDFGKVREKAFEEWMHKVFPGERTTYAPGDAERDDAAAHLRTFRVGLSADRSELDNLSESELATRLLCAEFAAQCIQAIFHQEEKKRLADDAVKSLTKKANDARHAENREIAERLRAWYAENRHLFSSLDAAATAAIRVEPVAFTTARKHIGDAAKKLRSARKE